MTEKRHFDLIASALRSGDPKPASDFFLARNARSRQDYPLRLKSGLLNTHSGFAG